MPWHEDAAHCHFDFVLDFVKLNLSWTFFFINYVENETVFYVLNVFESCLIFLVLT